MTNAALADLSARIASNTLTLAQQNALTEALAEIIPTFPTPDEQSRSNGQVDQPLSRAWIAALYSLQAEGAGAMVLPTRQTVWHINATTGSNLNDGLTPGTALQSAAFLATLWRGTVGGGRPLLNPATGSTITVFLDSDLPSTDPLAPLLDVDLVSGMTLLFRGAAKNVTHAGTMTTASTYARTSAGGQQTFTDAGVGDFSPFVGTASLTIDTTTGGIGWLYAPRTASATATVSRMYTSQAPGVLSVPTVSDPAAGDGYALTDVTNVFLGTGFITRTFGSANAEQAIVVFYRQHVAQQNPTTLQSLTVPFFFQECQTDTELVASAGAEVVLVNCFGFNVLYEARGAGTLFEAFAGAMQGGAGGGANNCTGISGGGFLSDGDFVLASDGSFVATSEGFVELGNVARYSNTATTGTPAIINDGAHFASLPINQGTSVFYGTDGGTVIAIEPNAADGSYTGTAVATFQFTSAAFTLGKAETSGWSFNETTGAYVGPTTNTFAHLDAAQGAGTGFGGNAVDPATGCILAVAA